MSRIFPACLKSDSWAVSTQRPSLILVSFPNMGQEFFNDSFKKKHKSFAPLGQFSGSTQLLSRKPKEVFAVEQKPSKWFPPFFFLYCFCFCFAYLLGLGKKWKTSHPSPFLADALLLWLCPDFSQASSRALMASLGF